MNQMFNIIGRKAVDMVGAMINRNEYTLPEQAVVVNIPSVWNDGPSVADLTRKKTAKSKAQELANSNLVP